MSAAREIRLRVCGQAAWRQLQPEALLGQHGCTVIDA
jgi:hypothetical protein